MSLFQLLSRRTAVQTNPIVQRRPVQLQPAELKAVSGGGPRGTWSEPNAVELLAGPRGTW